MAPASTVVERQQEPSRLSRRTLLDGTMHFVCDPSHPAWGAGHARGVVTLDGGVRNVLTFPPSLP